MIKSRADVLHRLSAASDAIRMLPIAGGTAVPIGKLVAEVLRQRQPSTIDDDEDDLRHERRRTRTHSHAMVSTHQERSAYVPRDPLGDFFKRRQTKFTEKLDASLARVRKAWDYKRTAEMLATDDHDLDFRSRKGVR